MLQLCFLATTEAGTAVVLVLLLCAGKRMALQDWYECPSCHLPCSSQPFLAILAAEGKCPMCSAAVSMQDVRQVLDPLSSVALF